MAVWNVQQVTNWGCAYFAASSTTKPVKATGGAASNTSFNAAQAQGIATKDQFTGAYTDVASRVLSLSVTGQTLRAVVQFKSTSDTAWECKSVALLSDNNVIAILSSSEVIFTIPASSTSFVGVSVDFNIVFTNTGQATVDVSTANTAMQSDLDRLVSCHVAGDSQTGEAQTVRGEKTFADSVLIDGRLLPVQEYSYLGDIDHVWHYAHINELTAAEVSANTYLGAATQIKATRNVGLYLTDSSWTNMSTVSPTTLSDIIANRAFGFVGDNTRVGVGEICYIDLTRGLEDVRNVSFAIPRGTTVGTGVTFSASSNTFHLRAFRQDSSSVLADNYRFVILSPAVMPAVDASQTPYDMRTTVLAACVNGD